MIDNLRLAVNSPGNPHCQCNNFQPLGYSQLHTLAHVATDYEVVLYLLIPNGTAENTQNLQRFILQDECFSRSNLEVLGFMFNVVPPNNSQLLEYIRGRGCGQQPMRPSN